jgi:nitrogenase molybdenum-iron protein alpha/beta subunit
VHNTITALFEKTGSTRTANWLGHYLRPDENHPLLLKLQQSNITSRHLLDCKTVEELRQMGNAAVNIVAGPMALPAARILKNRFGTPYYNLVNPADPDSLSEEALLAL